jgi:hypothetical protein
MSDQNLADCLNNSYCTNDHMRYDLSMKFIQYAIIICVIALGIWTYLNRQELIRKPAMVFAQRDVKLEFRPLLDKNSHVRQSPKKVFNDTTNGFHASQRRPKISREEAFRLRRQELLARENLSTIEIALEMEIARLNSLRAQSIEANELVSDIMDYFEKIKTDRSLSKRYKNVPTDELGQALSNEHFGEMVIKNKNVLNKWKRLMAISAENDEIAITSIEN